MSFLLDGKESWMVGVCANRNRKFGFGISKTEQFRISNSSWFFVGFAKPSDWLSRRIAVNIWSANTHL